MWRFLRSKLKNKLWLNFCLLLGLILLVAVMSCQPMFRIGSMDRYLLENYQDLTIEKNVYPAVIGRTGSLDIEKYNSFDKVMERMQKYHSKWKEYLGIDPVDSQIKFLVKKGYGVSRSTGSKSYGSISYMDQLEKHIQIVAGEMYADAESGPYPCLIGERMMDENGLVVGEILDYSDVYLTDSNGGGKSNISFVIAGVFQEKDVHDCYWHIQPKDIEKEMFVSKEVFEKLISNGNYDKLYFEQYEMLDYTQINARNVKEIHKVLKQIVKEDELFVENLTEGLEQYEAQEKTIKTMLVVLELPVIVLLLAFIYMVSGQILFMEMDEIAMLKSRGVTTLQIVTLYVEQSGILAVIALVIGLPLGIVFGKLAALTDAFFEFSLKDVSQYHFVWEMIPYGLFALLTAMILIVIPVLKYAKLSIVEQKREKSTSKKLVFWQKYYIDILLLLISGYLLFNYNKQQSAMALDILSGKAVDPVVFLDSSLFIFAAGLLLVRLIQYFVRFVYYLGRNKWSPAMYASFLQITRTANKQSFISVFLVMTIAMGIFDSNMARTVNQNNEERIRYDVGTDLVVQEQWNVKIFRPDQSTIEWYYEEPDFERYERLDESMHSSVTRVLVDNNVNVAVSGSGTMKNCQMMAIHTKEFGETAMLKDGVNDEHWYHALNALAQDADGVIISRNLADKCNLKIGDKITFERFAPIVALKDSVIASMSGTVCAIVDGWPAYRAYSYEKNNKGELIEMPNYLVVANYAYVVNASDLTPYQTWIRYKKNQDTSDVLAALKDAGVHVKSYASLADDVEKMRGSSMIQITNGMFTLSFFITFILCIIGFLIYWINSIKQRELLFGIYRAMGMGMKELNQMLVNEHIFSSLLAALAGCMVGTISTKLFVKILAIVYLPEKHSIPIDIYIYLGDMLKVIVMITLMFVICLFVLRKLLSNMKITQALKLGED